MRAPPMQGSDIIAICYRRNVKLNFWRSLNDFEVHRGLLQNSRSGKYKRMMESRQRASPQQFAALVEFMERHGDLTRPQSGSQGRVRSERLWNEVMDMLNSMGSGVTKTTDKWKKVWIDLKAKTKKKYLAIRRDLHGTGGGPGSRFILSDQEQKVLDLMGGSSAVMGLAEVSERGLLDSNEPNAEVLDLPSSLQFIADEPISTSRGLSPLPNSPPLPAPAPPPPAQRTPTRQGHRRRVFSERGGSESRSPATPSASPRGAGAGVVGRRRRTPLTPFERAAEAFSAVERRRIQLDAERQRRQHELEVRRLDQEDRRDATLNRLVNAIEHFSEAIRQMSNKNTH